MTALLPYALLLLLTAAALVVPLLRRRPAAVVTRGDSTASVLRDKLVQVARDRADGLIGADEAAAVEREIARALIAAHREAAAEPRDAARPGSRAGLALLAVAALAGSVGVYGLTGSFAEPDLPLAGREPALAGGQPTLISEHEGAMMTDAIVSLRSRLESDPGNVDNWHLLARSYATVGAYAEAAEAYGRLVALAPLEIGLRADRAEALIRADGGFVGPQATEELRVVLAHAPEDPRALYYMALHDAQNGDAVKAAQGWARILRNAPPDAPYIPAIRQILDAIVEDAGLDRAALDLPPAAAEPAGPSPADVAAVAEMPPDQQLQMIRGMVARLEERLQQAPDDVDGWLRLARSRAVLGEPEAAVAALEQGLAANPGDARLAEALAALRP